MVESNHRAWDGVSIIPTKSVSSTRVQDVTLNIKDQPFYCYILSPFTIVTSRRTTIFSNFNFRMYEKFSCTAPTQISTNEKPYGKHAF